MNLDRYVALKDATVPLKGYPFTDLVCRDNDHMLRTHGPSRVDCDSVNFEARTSAVEDQSSCRRLHLDLCCSRVRAGSPTPLGGCPSWN
jgi:hypothetical protein